MVKELRHYRGFLCPRNGVLSPVCKVNEQDNSFVHKEKKTAVGVRVMLLLFEFVSDVIKLH